MVVNYSTINRPYDNNLDRSQAPSSITAGDVNLGITDFGTIPSLGGVSINNENGLDSPFQLGENIIDGKAVGNLWIQNFIKSQNYKPKKQGFYFDGIKGYIEAMDIYVSGSIIGGSIDIPNTTSVNSWHVDSSGNMWSGALIYNISTNPFAVSSAGVIRAVSGEIGGNTLGSNFISSSNFVSGLLGSGWREQSTGSAEFQDVIIRGTIRTSVFEKDTISAVNGIVLISKADVLASDMTALDSSTLTIGGETTFATNEIIRIKDGNDDEWMLVTDISAAPTYTVTRDLASSYSADNNPVWKKGTAIVSMGVGAGTKTGYILLDSSSSSSPFIDVYGRNSNTYTDTTLHGRIGWLQGIVDADVGLNSTDVWGIYTDNAYIKGVIVANTGYIGGSTGWVIAAGSISSVNGGNTTAITSGGTNAYIAGTTGSPEFIVTHTGAFTATSATIIGGTISGGTIAIGSGNNIFKADSNGIYLGNSSFSSAPFTVDMLGNTTVYRLTNKSILFNTITAPSATDGQLWCAENQSNQKVLWGYFGGDTSNKQQVSMSRMFAYGDRDNNNTSGGSTMTYDLVISTWFQPRSIDAKGFFGDADSSLVGVCYGFAQNGTTGINTGIAFNAILKSNVVSDLNVTADNSFVRANNLTTNSAPKIPAAIDGAGHITSYYNNSNNLLIGTNWGNAIAIASMSWMNNSFYVLDSWRCWQQGDCLLSSNYDVTYTNLDAYAYVLSWSNTSVTIRIVSKPGYRLFCHFNVIG